MLVCELPIGFGAMIVSMALPSRDLCLDGLLVGDASAQALPGQNGELGLGHVEPASVLWRVMPFEAVDEAARFGGGEGGVERSWRMRAQVVLNQHDFLGGGEMQLIAETRAPIPAKPGQPARHDYEYERNGVANLFMIFAPLEGWRRVEVTDHHAAVDYAKVLKGLSDVLGGLVQAHERTIGISRPLVGFQHVFHGGDKARVGLGRDHPLLMAMRSENVFFSVRPICVVAGLVDDVQFDDFLLEETQAPTGEPLRRRRASQSDELRLRRPVEYPRPSGVGVGLALQRRLKPPSGSRCRVFLLGRR